MTDRGQHKGQHLGNYRLIRLLGRGNFADVYLGKHVHLNTEAAIKVLHGPLESHDVEGFLNEARTIAHLRHPHIVQVLDFGIEATMPFLVMDYAPNGNMRQRYPKGTRLPLDTIITSVTQVAAALQYAHQEKLIHRDIKPENMLLGYHHEILLSDFGLAVMTQSSQKQPVWNTAGTMAYMAPEQFQGKPCAASDQYALGVVTYEWFCGDRPFHGTSTELYSQHLFAPPPPLREKVPAILPAVEQVVFKAMAKDPEERFDSVQAFAIALEKACKTEVSGQTLFLFAPDASMKHPIEAEPKADHLKVRTHNLPAQLSPLIGREQEMQAVCSLLRRPEVRLVTLTGPGGVGKTRLGLQVTADLLNTFPDGVCFVPLAPVSNPDLVSSTIAQTLGIQEAGEWSYLELLQASLRDKHLLLFLET